jgi:hypothetical protein
VNDSKFGSCGYMLETAAAWSNSQFVQMVLDAKPDANAVGGHYGTALRAAALQGHEEVRGYCLAMEPTSTPVEVSLGSHCKWLGLFSATRSCSYY